MSIHNKLEPIYKLTISSLEDIERVLNNREEDKQKISEILKVKYSYGIEKTARYFNIGNLFKEGYWKSLGFTSCLEFVRGIDRYQDLLKHSITVCKDRLTPLFISSFKCHQTALHYYTNGQQKSAMTAMAETGKAAKKIAGEYETLGKKFMGLRDQEVQAWLALKQEHVSICTKQRELAAKQKKGEDIAASLLVESILKGVTSLHSAISSLWKIQTALINVSRFWSLAEKQSAALADLADPDMIELMVCGEAGAVEKEFCELLEGAEQVTNTTMPNWRQQITLSEVVKSMKTGTCALIPNVPKKRSISKLVESTQGIEKEFENSYLNWLALAKVHQAMVNMIEETIIKVEKTRTDISHIERDPLVIALHATTLGS